MKTAAPGDSLTFRLAGETKPQIAVVDTVHNMHEDGIRRTVYIATHYRGGETAPLAVNHEQVTDIKRSFWQHFAEEELRRRRALRRRNDRARKAKRQKERPTPCQSGSASV